MKQPAPKPLWSPGPEVADTQIVEFARQAGYIAGRDLSN